jgi:hypothetical protein
MSEYQLNPKQRAFIFDRAKYTAFYGGIRNGKTVAGILKALFLSEAFPFNLGVIARQTYRELEDTTAKIALDIIKKRNGGTLDPGPYIKRYDKNPDTITLYNDSQIMFRHMANIESILGMDLGWFYLDQAEFISEEVYDQLEGRLSRWGWKNVEESKRVYQLIHGKPYEGGKHRAFGFITGNPAPGWVKRRYKKGVDAEGVPYKAGTYTIYEASSEENRANLGDDYIDDLRRTHTQRWVDRYIEGDWETFEGQVYEDFSRTLHVVAPFNLPNHWPRHIGWDHGTVNPTSVSWIAVDEDGNFILYREYYEVSAVIREHAEAVMKLGELDPLQRGEDGKSILVWMDPATAGDKDPTSGRDFMELYRELGILGLKANKAVKAGVQKVASLFRPDPAHPYPRWHPKAGEYGSPRLFFFSNCHATIHEHELYHYPQKKLGEEKNAEEVPEKYMDHSCDSVRYAIFSVFGKAEEPKKQPKKGEDAYLAGVYKKLLSM